jgi:uncharacterized OB-fold protein
MVERKLLPTVDRDSAPYWRALAEGRLDLQHCKDCGRWTWPARPICSGCQGENLVWEPVKGTGQIWSWVVTHQVYGPEFATLVPYTIANVRLDEQSDIYIPARLVSDVEPRRGLRVRAVPEKINDEIGDLLWEAI